ncbi:MAG: hypothetical protein FJW39_22700 [Acidobacteria bacterium]|nr:hypothetical protein [Acidobacteriota bacterium]
MDRRIEDNLERYLHGSLDPRARTEFDGVLAMDDETRRLVEQFEQHAKLIRSALRPEAETDPAPGFYARVMDRIEAQRGNSFWSLFLEPVFFRRLAVASAALLVLLGVLLVSPPAEQAVMAGIEQVLAQPDSDDAQWSVDEHQDRNRDALLVNLTTYGE